MDFPTKNYQIFWRDHDTMKQHEASKSPAPCTFPQHLKTGVFVQHKSPQAATHSKIGYFLEKN